MASCMLTSLGLTKVSPVLKGTQKGLIGASWDSKDLTKTRCKSTMTQKCFTETQLDLNEFTRSCELKKIYFYF